MKTKVHVKGPFGKSWCGFGENAPTTREAEKVTCKICLKSLKTYGMPVDIK